MNDDKRKRLKDVESEPDDGDENDERELTFEHGYGAQEQVVVGDEALEDVADVSEKDVREDLLKAQQDEETEA